MNKFSQLLGIAALAASFVALTTPAMAEKSIWEELNESAPRTATDKIHSSTPTQAPKEDLTGR